MDWLATHSQRLFAVLLLALFAALARPTLAQPGDRRCETSATALEQAIALQTSGTSGLSNSGRLPNLRLLARQTIEDIEHWVTQKPLSALMLLGPSPQGICAWIWQGSEVSGFLLSEDLRNALALPEQIMAMHLPPSGNPASGLQNAPDRASEIMKNWQIQWLPRTLQTSLAKAKDLVIMPGTHMMHLPWNALVIQAFGQAAATPSVTLSQGFKSALDTRLHWEPLNNSDRVLIVKLGFGASTPQTPLEKVVNTASNNIEVLFADRANTARLASALEDSDLVFLTPPCRKEVNPSKEQGFITLVNGKLDVEAILDLKFRKRAVVALSSCELGFRASNTLRDGASDHASDRASDGINAVSLPRAFQSVGAAGVVMGSWGGDQQAIQLLMEYFVQELKNVEPARALIRAQILLRSQYPDPRYWGAFNYFGTPISMTK
jgi:CHAT domain